MNQIVGHKEDGTPFLALVLEPGNIHKLRDGLPILVRIEDHFPEGIPPRRLELLIFHSDTPIADARELAKTAEMTFDERSAVQKKPHCHECKSTVEQLGIWRNESPIALIFCPACGCVFGIVPSPAVAALPKEGA